MTAGSARRGPVVVGTDGSESASRAVRWAAGEAARRGAVLLVVHVYALVPRTVPRLVAFDVYRDAVRDEGAALLADAAAVVGRVAPGVVVETELCEGWAAQRLVERSASAELVVLGSRGLGGFTGLLVGSTAVAVAGHGRCPVVVVRGQSAEPGPAAPVVVGVDGSPASAAVIAFAFAAAAARGVPLVAVHSWWDQPLGARWAATPAVWDWAAIRAERTDWLDGLLAERRAAFPEVPVRSVVVRDRPAPTLLDQADRAALVVVGCRGRGGFQGLVLGSTSQALIQHAACPVAVVPPQRP